MNYFVSKDELLFEVNKAVDAVFSAVARMFSDKDEELKGKLKALEANFLLLINTVGQRSHQPKERHGLKPVTRNKNRRKNMERKFEEILEDVVSRVMKSGDDELIILIDELDQSFKDEEEKKEKIKGKLREIFKKGKDFIKEQEGEKEAK